MNGQLTEPLAEIHQIIGRDLLIAENDQFVLDKSLLDCSEYLLLERLTKIDAADLGAQIDPDAVHSNAAAFHVDRSALPVIHGFVHTTVLPLTFIPQSL